MPRLPASPAASGRGRRPPRTRPWLTRDAAPGIGVGEARVERLVAWALAGVLAIMLLAVALGPHRIGDYSTETDFYGAYADGARLIQHGHLDATRYGVIGPVYEVTLALAGLVVRDLFLAAELISVLAMTATLLLWFVLLRRRAGARPPMGAGAEVEGVVEPVRGWVRLDDRRLCGSSGAKPGAPRSSRSCSGPAQRSASAAHRPPEGARPPSRITSTVPVD